MGCLWGVVFLRKQLLWGGGLKEKKKELGLTSLQFWRTRLKLEDIKNFQRVNGSRSWEKCLCF